ncbi:hypothetical protein [Pannonibacter phragmitetus]|uniref:hypothetical protein n=1 Tax=Pannonibacter phragmitetus TaxID=121719 RepID=UPI0012FDECC9|nr:hypothetical protein [Pannonibacter phragmitetus]
MAEFLFVTGAMVLGFWLWNKFSEPKVARQAAFEISRAWRTSFEKLRSRADLLCDKANAQPPFLSFDDKRAVITITGEQFSGDMPVEDFSRLFSVIIYEASGALLVDMISELDRLSERASNAGRVTRALAFQILQTCAALEALRRSAETAEDERMASKLIGKMLSRFMLHTPY